MNYMPIVPIGMFDVLDGSDSRHAFILSHMWKIKEYKEYYESRQWETVIIDNAIYEEGICYPFPFMMEIAEDIQADRTFIVGPEDLNDGMRTVYDTIHCIEQYGTKGCGANNQWELMTILNGDPITAATQVNKLHERVGDDIAYGIPVSATRMGYDRGSIRAYLDLNPDQYIHAFGLDNLLEINNLRHTKFDSIDSSIAVTAAIRGINLNRELFVRRPPGTKPGSNRVPLTETSFTQREKVAASNNIHLIHDWCDMGITA